jgi:hypothetical protein
MRIPNRLVITSVCLLALAAGCNPGKSVFQLGLPGTHVALEVSRVTQRGGVLDATLSGEAWELRTFVPPSEACTAIFTPGSAVRLQSSGGYGTFARDELRCDAIGIGSLEEWRSKQPRGDDLGGKPISSARASYRLVYEDDEVAFLRGTFPLAGRLGFPAMGDSIAVVPKVELCERAIRSDGATLEYFQTGSHVLTLGAPNGRCSIAGLFRPPNLGD